MQSNNSKRLGDISNAITIQFVRINQLIHELDFEPTDDAEKHLKLLDAMSDLGKTLAVFSEQLSKAEERIWGE